ncbi:MAG: heavy metal translocating P-type ATPase [Bacilli bacterium]
MKQKFDIKGMTCTACQAHVNDAVKKDKGVTEVNVSLLTNSMTVEYDSNIINSDEIIDSVKKAGYDAELHSNLGIKQLQEKKQKELKNRRNKLIVSIVFLILLLIFSMGHMILMNFNITLLIHNPIILFSIQIILLTPIVILNFGYFTRGFKSLFSLHPNMDTLIAVGSLFSILYGLYAFIMMIYNKSIGLDYMQFENKIYFESAGTILTLVSLGKYFENKATAKTSEVISKLVALAPEFTTILKDKKEVSIPTEELKINDIVVIKEGTSIPADGIIIDGYGNINESSITGEAIPVYKKKGDEVISGTINKLGVFYYKVQKVGEDTTLNKIITLVQEASNSKVPLAKLADKVASVFVPVVMGISLITFIVWLFISNYNFEQAINFAISVLVISCPCALGLATPVAIMVGTGKGAENGILIKSGEAFEKLNKVNTIIMDKTGTITTGIMSVYDVYGDKTIINDVASIEKMSIHPLSEAIVRYANIKDENFKKVENYRYIPGLGMSGNINKDSYIIGNKELMTKFKIEINNDFLNKFKSYNEKGNTTIFVARNNKVVMLISIADSIRNDSLSAISTLKSLGKEVILLTGDNEIVAKYTASLLGIDKFYANVKPENKLEKIEQLQKNGKKIAMIGDGINDAPALKQADVGIAIGAGTDIAIESADIILIKSSLLDVVSAIELSKKVVQNIKGNLFWAFFYNVIGIPLAAGVLFFNPIYVELNPMIASVAMSLSSITVVLNAMRLKFFKRKDIINK